MTTSTPIRQEQAPCGRTVDGKRVRDADDDGGFVVERTTYACGCYITVRQFHDGGIQQQVVDHHGRVRSDEHSATHEA